MILDAPCVVHAGHEEEDVLYDLGPIKTGLTPLFVNHPSSPRFPFYLSICKPMPLPFRGCPKNIVGYKLDQFTDPPACHSLGTFETFALNRTSDTHGHTRAIATASGGDICKDNTALRNRLKISFECTKGDESVKFSREEDCVTEFRYQTPLVCADQAGDGRHGSHDDDKALTWCEPFERTLSELPQLTFEAYTIHPCAAASNCPDGHSVCLRTQDALIPLGKHGKVQKGDRTVTVSYVDAEACPDGLQRKTTVEYVCKTDEDATLSVLEDSKLVCGRTKLRYSSSRICSILQPFIQPVGDISPSGGPALSEILLLFLIVSVAYFVLGYLYKWVYWGQRGWEAIPNVDSLRSVRDRVRGRHGRVLI